MIVRSEGFLPHLFATTFSFTIIIQKTTNYIVVYMYLHICIHTYIHLMVHRRHDDLLLPLTVILGDPHPTPFSSLQRLKAKACMWHAYILVSKD